MSTSLDKRLHAYRPDLADIRLKDRVTAERYVEGETMRVTAPFADLLASPDEQNQLQAQVLHGHDVLVFETKDGWCWCQSASDGYVGYVRSDALGKSVSATTHYVTAPRTFLYSQTDLKSPRAGYRSIGSHITVVDFETVRGTDYAVVESGDAVIAKHIAALGTWQSDPVSMAETLLHTPYLWGGNTGFGIDCSGLVQLTMACCGQTVLRDSDMQEASIGSNLGSDITALRRGDLVFWKGHVGMMADAKNLLHANGHTMNVALEPLADAVERIAYLYGQPTTLRRP